MAHASGGSVCHQVQQQTFQVCFSGARSKGLENLCIEPALGGLYAYAFPPMSILGQVVSQGIDQGCRQMIVIALGLPNMSWFCDLVNLLVQVPLSLPPLENLLTQPFSKCPHRDLHNLNLHAWLPKPQASKKWVSLRA